MNKPILNRCFPLFVCTLMVQLCCIAPLNAQTVIGGDTIDQSAILDIQDTAKGVLLPRLTSAQRDAMIKPATGLIIYNTTQNCIQINRGTVTAPIWNCVTILPDQGNQIGEMLYWSGSGWVQVPLGQPGQLLALSADGLPAWTGPAFTSIDCGNIEVTGELIAGKQSSGVMLHIPYQGGNGSGYSSQTTPSTGVSGLMASLLPGVLNTGPGTLAVTISGTPSIPGQATFSFLIGGKSCLIEVPVKKGSIDALRCDETTLSGVLTFGLSANATGFNIPYAGGNGGSYEGLSFQSTGVGGLIAEVVNGKINQGDGTLGFKVTGTPDGMGVAVFAVNLEGKLCTVPWNVVEGTVTSLECASVVTRGTLSAGIPATGIRSAVPYKGGNGGSFQQRSIPSTGITGLSAQITAGKFTTGDDSLWLTISGTPNSSGIAVFLIEIGNKSCSLSINVLPLGKVSALKCAEAVHTGFLKPGVENPDIWSEIPYAGGNGGTFNGFTVNSTGVSGLVARLDTGILDTGAGVLRINITGKPNGYGKAVFEIRLNDSSCNLERSIFPCGANMGNGQWKELMCHNLGAANMDANPFTPGWEINGGYWQWGKKQISAQGSSGPGSASANSDAIAGWSTAMDGNGNWSDGAKNANDPCPEGFRIPSKAEWEQILGNNPVEATGTWTQGESNYSSGIRIGQNLFLPAAGLRSEGDGSLLGRGSNGYYWSSTSLNRYLSWNLILSNCGANIEDNLKGVGFSVRCIKQ